MVRGRSAVLALAVALLPGVAACSRGVVVPPSTSTTSTPSTGSTSTATTSASSSTSTSPGPGLLRVAIPFDQPGLGMRAGDDFSGLDVDVARYVAQQLGAQRIEFLEAVPGQRETLIATDQADLVIATYSMTPERVEQVAFAGPYLVTGQDLLVPRSSKVRSVGQLRGEPVCGAEGSASVRRLVDDHPGLHIVERPTVGECVDMLRDGDVRAVTSDTTILAGYLEAATKDVTKGKPAPFRIAGVDFGSEVYGIGMAREDDQLCYAVSEALRTMVSSGEWAKTVRANLPSAKVIGAKTYQEPTVRTCAEPPTSTTSTTSPGSTPASSSPASS